MLDLFTRIRTYPHIREVILSIVALAVIAVTLAFTPRGTWTYVALAVIVGTACAMTWKWNGLTRTTSGTLLVVGGVMTLLSAFGQVRSIQDGIRGTSSGAPVAITRQYGLPSKTRETTVVNSCAKQSCRVVRRLPGRMTVYMVCYIDVQPPVHGSPRWFEISLRSDFKPALGFTYSWNIVEQAETPLCPSGRL
jgi:hypothetical protein